MSDMIINDSVPVDKKWGELIRYNIFIMKLVEFGISTVLTILPVIIPKPEGHMYCISSGPTLVISLLFIILYLRRKVVALILNIIPHVVEPVEFLYCLVAGPTLMTSALLMVLYVVDQVQFEVEMYYVVIELALTTLGLISLIIVGKISGAIYGLFYADLIVAFSIDLYYMHKERGWTF